MMRSAKSSFIPLGGGRSRQNLIVLAARYPRLRNPHNANPEAEHPAVRAHVDELMDGLTESEREIVASITDSEVEEYLRASDDLLAGIFPVGI